MSAIIAILNISMQVLAQIIRKEKQSKKQKSLLENRKKKLLFDDDDIKNLQTNVENK